MKREIQKERPPPLHINNQESKNQRRRSSMPVMQFRQPVIIHTFSPEIIHTEAQNFMRLVQRLTGQASRVSPLSKRPRLVPPPARAVTIPLHEQHLMGNYSSSSEQLRNTLGLRTILSPHNKLGLGSHTPRARLQADLSPQKMFGLQGANTGLSPSIFSFSPSALPSPSTFLQEFPSLLSPAGVMLPLPRLAMVGGRGGRRSPGPMSLPVVLPSPGPLTSAFLADLPLLSPTAYSIQMD